VTQKIRAVSGAVRCSLANQEARLGEREKDEA